MQLTKVTENGCSWIPRQIYTSINIISFDPWAVLFISSIPRPSYACVSMSQSTNCLVPSWGYFVLYKASLMTLSLYQCAKNARGFSRHPVTLLTPSPTVISAPKSKRPFVLSYSLVSWCSTNRLMTDKRLDSIERFDNKLSNLEAFGKQRSHWRKIRWNHKTLASAWAQISVVICLWALIT